MRKIIVLAAAATLASATVAGAQQQPKPAAPSAQPAAPAIQSVNIVDFSELPQATQTQVNQVIAKRGDAALQKLRSSIDATPQLKSALEAKGLTSAQVVAASMTTNGALTLVTKKAS